MIEETGIDFVAEEFKALEKKIGRENSLPIIFIHISLSDRRCISGGYGRKGCSLRLFVSRTDERARPPRANAFR